MDSGRHLPPGGPRPTPSVAIVLRDLRDYLWEQGSRIAVWFAVIVGFGLGGVKALVDGDVATGVWMIMVGFGLPVVWSMVFYFGFAWIAPSRWQRRR